VPSTPCARTTGNARPRRSLGHTDAMMTQFAERHYSVPLRSPCATQARSLGTRALAVSVGARARASYVITAAARRGRMPRPPRPQRWKHAPKRDPKESPTSRRAHCRRSRRPTRDMRRDYAARGASRQPAFQLTTPIPRRPELDAVSTRSWQRAHRMPGTSKCAR